MRPITPREHLLLIAALLVVVAMGYGLIRVRPKGAEVGRIDQAAEIARTRLEGVSWPRPAGEPEILEEKLEELRLAISSLADRCGVRVLENVICPRTTVGAYLGSRAGVTQAERPAAQLVRFLAMGEPYSLTAREVTLDAPYGGIRSFLEGLAELEKRVVVMRFSIAVNRNARPGTAPLRAKFLLVF